MRAILLMAAMVVGASAVAGQKVALDKIEKPGTIIIRQKIDDPTHIEVVPVSEKLPKGKIVEHLLFQKVAKDSEVSGQKVTAANELDQDSSRSSWGYYYGGIGMGYGMGWGMGMGYGYGMSWGWGYPYYGYMGYNFGYMPYWGYAMGGWNYAYAGWGGGYW